MKMVKKILLGLAATAAVIAFVGCGTTVGNDKEEEGGKKIINGSTQKAYLGEKDGEGYENTSDSTNREMKLFATKHYDSFVALTLTDETKTSVNGQLGYVFNYTENKDDAGTVNFITIGYRNNAGTIDTYISQYYNISTAEFDKPNFGASKDVNNRVKGTDFFVYKASDVTAETLAAIKASGKPTEIEIVILGETIGDLTFENLKNDAGELTIGVDVIANDGTETGKPAGSYTVNYYKGLTDKYKKASTSTLVKTAFVSNVITGYTKKTETKIGAYVAVYKNSTLNGFWRFSEITGEDIPLEEFAD